MKKHLALLFLILLLSINIASAYSIEGYIKNIHNFYLKDVRVDFNNSYVFTDSVGYFQFTNISGGTYDILLREIGYKNQSDSLYISTNSTKNYTMIENGSAKGYVPDVPGFEGIYLIIIVISIFSLKKRF